jgi:drug/metabolite transporter (DMT)-like permease
VLGILYGVSSSAAFGLNAAIARRGLLGTSASQGLYITVFGGVPLFFLAALVSGQLFQATTVSAWDFSLMLITGPLHLVFGRYCTYRSYSALGANRTAPIVGLNLVVAVVIAVMFLGETVSPIMWGGIALIGIGPLLVARRGNPRKQSTTDVLPSAPSPDIRPNGPWVADKNNIRLAEGYTFGVLAAIAWGAGPVLMRASIDSNGLGFYAALITTVSAAVFLLPTLALPGQLSGMIKMDPRARLWFVAVSVDSFVAVTLRWMALAIAPVSIIIPLVQTGPIFGLGFNYLINRRSESFSIWVISGILLTVVGAVVVAA